MDAQIKKEIHFLMRFFSQPQFEQWKQVPDEFPKIIFDHSPFYTQTDEPIKFLSLVLVNLTHGIRIDLDDECLAEILYEAHILLGDIMLEYLWDAIFSKRDEPVQFDYVWKTFGRICREALKFESLTKFETDGLDFDYFVKKYAIIK